MFKGRQKAENFLELVNKTTLKLQTWKTKSVTKAGRMALI